MHETSKSLLSGNSALAALSIVYLFILYPCFKTLMRNRISNDKQLVDVIM